MTGGVFFITKQFDLLKRKAGKTLKSKGGRTSCPDYSQRRAYVSYNEQKVEAWWQTVRSSDKPPNREQENFLQSVIERCHAEREEMHRMNAPAKNQGKQKLSETERICLLGIPGAGKSHCLQLLRDFFENCLGWTHGVQFQFLATQNSMAELIGGGTVHTWGVIPANKTQASSKYGNKDVDWDQLFENCLSMRWVIIDEVSTLSPGLLAMLESFMRDKACIRHPYAFRDPRHRRHPFPFGGINMVFSGDLWQLPPVKDSAIFYNPSQRKDGDRYEAGEQRMFSMFWDCKDPKKLDVITKLHELVECKRTKDPWLHAVLTADRLGNESWEMYCFIHGLPTKNPGSWNPESNLPTCGNELCRMLPVRWDLFRSRYQMQWTERRAMECQVCTEERKRRCCIISQCDNAARYKTGVFTMAPFVHPFRSPTNHAQRLRSLQFAREQGSRVLWVIAYDSLTAKDGKPKQAVTAATQQRWLTLDDRKTAGIPGFFPLILDLPIRFTQEPTSGDRLKGVFTNARGWLRGWTLPDKEQERVGGTDDHELALCQRPDRLFIEMASANTGLELIDGRRIYTLRQHCKPWYKDGDARQVEVQRFGFPIVPDFGGTAHSYCGTSLDACIGDLLDWWQKPTRDGTVRGYIIKSRVREAQNLLLAKPYSPHLFRLGPPAGPNYLLKVLQGAQSKKNALAEWSAAEKKAATAQEEAKENEPADKWPRCMPLPCRDCGKEKPLSAFTTYFKYDEIWAECISKGQDLVCARCRHAKGKSGTTIILCDGCDKQKCKRNFALDMQQLWENLREDI